MMKKLFTSLIWFYQGTFSPLLRVFLGKGCVFKPTCSEYAREAIEKFGVFKGGALALRRLSRCHP